VYGWIPILNMPSCQCGHGRCGQSRPHVVIAPIAAEPLPTADPIPIIAAPAIAITHTIPAITPAIPVIPTINSAIACVPTAMLASEMLSPFTSPIDSPQPTFLLTLFQFVHLH